MHFLLTRRELLALTLVFTLSLPAVTSRLYSSDEVQYYSYLRSLYFDGDVSFENEYRYFYENNIAQSGGFHETFLERETAAGRRVNYATMGCAILWLPFYATADVIVRATGIAEADGFSKPYVRGVAYASAFYGFLAVLLSIRAARHRGKTGHRGNTEETQDRDRQTGHRGNTEETQGRQGNAGHGGNTGHSGDTGHRRNTEEAQGRQENTGHGGNTGHRGDTEETQVGEFDGVFWAGVAVWLGTPLLFYMYVAPPFSHAASAFGVALFVNVWLHVRQRWSARGAFGLGLCAALLAMIREQDVFVAIGPAVDFALSASISNARFAVLNASHGPQSSGGRPFLQRGLIVAAGAGLLGFVVGYLPQLLAYNALNGYPGPASHVARKMYWYAPHGLQVLFSPHHGFLFWTPLTLLAIVGLVLLAVRRSAAGDSRRIGIIALLMVASQVYVAGSVASWTVAGAFGQRRFVCLTVILVIGLAALFSVIRGTSARPDGRAHTRPLAYAVPVVVALCVWWNIALMFQFATGLMNRQRLEPGRNAYHAFVTLPREAPALVYRYLTNRESFYRPPARTP